MFMPFFKGTIDSRNNFFNAFISAGRNGRHRDENIITT